jgi:hypothetical protein
LPALQEQQQQFRQNQSCQKLVSRVQTRTTPLASTHVALQCTSSGGGLSQVNE